MKDLLIRLHWVCRCLCLLAAFCIAPFMAPGASVAGDPPGLVTLSTIKTRSLSMGGAFTSIRDDLAALDFNPATFTLDPYAGENRFYAFLNPIGPYLSFKNRHAYSDWTVPVGMCVRGIGLSMGRIDIGVLFGEESLRNQVRLERRDFFNGSKYETERNNSLGFSFALAPRVSLGFAGEMFIRNRDWHKLRFGYRYGLVVQPRTNIAVGLCYMDFPDEYKNDRVPLERLSDETLNVGISYAPWTFLQMALDIRNVSDEDKSAAREPHLGLELQPLRHLILRGGYARSTDGKLETFSFGLGLLDVNRFIWKTRSHDRPFFGIQSGCVFQNALSVRSSWFFLSCLIRIG